MPLVVDENGVQVQTMEEVRAEMFEDLRRDSPDGFGADFVLEETEIIPTVATIVAKRIAQNQQAIAAVATLLQPGSARGYFADNIGALTDIERLGQSRSTIEVQLTGTASAVIPTGRIYRHTPTGTLWNQIEAVTLDGSGEGTTFLQAEDYGPINITASANWEIVLGDPELDAVESIADSSAGRITETDEEYEERRKEELSTSGAATAKAIRGKVQQNLRDLGYEVDTIAVFVNNRHIFVDGSPPGSAEVLLDDNGIVPDDVIGAVIWDLVAAGIQPHGLTSVTITDEDGIARDVAFSRPTDIEVYVRVEISTTGAEVTITDEDSVGEAIADAVAAFGDLSHPIGRDVIPQRFIGSVFAAAPGGSIIQVAIGVGTSAPDSEGGTLAISRRERAIFDASRVEVVWL